VPSLQQVAVVPSLQQVAVVPSPPSGELYLYKSEHSSFENIYLLNRGKCSSTNSQLRTHGLSANFCFYLSYTRIDGKFS
jgi:hypothetical protein